MSESLDNIAKRLSELEKERTELIEWVKGRGYNPTDHVTFLNSEEEKRWSKLPSIEREIENLRQRYISGVLASIDESSRRLEEGTTALNRTTEQQVAATRALEHSSDRLNAVTEALLILTAVLAVTGAGSYSLQLFKEVGFSGWQAISYTGLTVSAVLFMVLVAFSIISRRHRRQAAQ